MEKFCFENIANLVRIKRINHPESYSQSELSTKLNYKNGQFVSNVERALCSIPMKKLKAVSEILNITKEEITQALVADLKKDIDNAFVYGDKPATITEVSNEQHTANI